MTGIQERNKTDETSGKTLTWIPRVVQLGLVHSFLLYLSLLSLSLSLLPPLPPTPLAVRIGSWEPPWPLMLIDSIFSALSTSAAGGAGSWLGFARLLAAFFLLSLPRPQGALGAGSRPHADWVLRKEASNSPLGRGRGRFCGFSGWLGNFFCVNAVPG